MTATPDESVVAANSPLMERSTKGMTDPLSLKSWILIFPANICPAESPKRMNSTKVFIVWSFEIVCLTGLWKIGCVSFFRADQAHTGFVSYEL